MRILFKIFGVAFVVIGASGYAGYLTTGRLPWQGMTWSPASAGLPELPAVPQASDDRPIYKWRDEGGSWVYSNDRPPDGVDFELVTVDPRANVVAPVKPVATEPAESAAPPQLADKSGRSDKASPKKDPNQPFLYSPEGVKKLIDDAKNVQQVIDEQARAQRELVNQL